MLPPPVQRPHFALVLRFVAGIALASTIALVKYIAQGGIHLAEILFWRQIVTVPLILGYFAGRGEMARLRTDRLPVHGRRAAIGVMGMFLNFGAAILLPLAESTTLGFTTPIFAVILSALILREHVGPVRWLAVALGFAGVLVIAQPGQAHMPPFGTAVGLSAGLMVALISIQVRDLGRTDEPLSIVFWFAALSSPILALAMPFVAQAHSPRQWLLLGALGVLGCAAQLLLTASLRVGKVASVVVIDYTTLIWATLYGWLIWDRLPGLATWLGAPLVIAAGVVIVMREHRLSRAPSEPQVAATAA